MLSTSGLPGMTEPRTPLQTRVLAVHRNGEHSDFVDKDCWFCVKKWDGLIIPDPRRCEQCGDVATLAPFQCIKHPGGSELPPDEGLTG